MHREFRSSRRRQFRPSRNFLLRIHDVADGDQRDVRNVDRPAGMRQIRKRRFGPMKALDFELARRDQWSAWDRRVPTSQAATSAERNQHGRR